MPGSLSPGRPPNERDLMLLLNGAPMFPTFPGLQFAQLIPGTNTQFTYQLGQAPATGVLTSTGAAVNNISTATAFATGALDQNTNRTLMGSMAGRVYLVNAVAAGSLMPSDSPLVNDPRYWTVALNTTIPPVTNTFPGVPLSAGDVRILVMGPTTGWLQWISATGTASLVCTELF
jgi:hypothetical protein